MADIKRLPVEELRERAKQWIGNDIGQRSAQELAEIVVVARYVHDLALEVAEQRGLASTEDPAAAAYRAWPAQMDLAALSPLNHASSRYPTPLPSIFRD